MTQWLVRTVRNKIEGPFSIEVVRQMITEGKLGVQDEVCPSGGYWFGLHEEREVNETFGVRVPRSKVQADQTQTETEVEKTDPDLDRTDPDRKAPGEARPAAAVVQIGSVAENAQNKPGYASAIYKTRSEAKIGAWRSLIWVLLLAIGFVVLSVWRLLMS
jgi:hypothetical protein